MASETEKMDHFTTNHAHPLTKEEREVLAMQTSGPATWPSSAAFILKCTSLFDGIALVISALAAIISGAAFPFSFVSWALSLVAIFELMVFIFAAFFG